MYLLYLSEVVKPWQNMEEILNEELWAMDSRFFSFSKYLHGHIKLIKES